jgi:divalent metal cation (Fe/Co/Zn/Cd) transporter
MIAILISFWVIYNWGRQGLAEIVNLIGVSASPEILQKLTYLAATHSPNEVQQVDTVIAYTSGTNFIAEVDLVLPPEMPLKEAHDVGESLQIKLEKIPGITRAFVHLDVDANHPPEHQ